MRERDEAAGDELSFAEDAVDLAGDRLLMIQTISVISANASASAANGAINDGLRTLSQRPDQLITPQPCAMIAEPISPPISA